MINYVPFLKAKRGELTAMGELNPAVKQAICPLFDFPRKKPDYTEEKFAATARSIATGLEKHWGTDGEFYFDDLDIGQTLNVKGEHQYGHILKALNGLQVIPVVALDRITHNAAVRGLKDSGEIASTIVAFRAECSDFEDFEANADQIEDDLGSVFEQFDAIDLLLDCRLCTSLNVSETAHQIAVFAKRFCKAYENVRRVVVTGSSIPASLGDLVKSTTTQIVARSELAILAKARELTDIDLLGGDYATVSPFYSDADFHPSLFQKVTSPRLIYSFDHSHYITRGASLASGGQGQYVGLTGTLCGQNFFRGTGYSTGEDYFDEKSQGHGNNATNGTVVKPSIVAHITYMALRAKH